MTHDEICIIASVCHEANRQYDLRARGDNSHKKWEDAPEWQQTSAIEGVRGIVSGQIKSPRDSHESWMQHKIETGWVYGEVKDEVAKTHPCMVDYDLLPPEQQKKDALFHGIVRALAGLPSQH